MSLNKKYKLIHNSLKPYKFHQSSNGNLYSLYIHSFVNYHTILKLKNRYFLWVNNNKRYSYWFRVEEDNISFAELESNYSRLRVLMK